MYRDAYGGSRHSRPSSNSTPSSSPNGSAKSSPNGGAKRARRRLREKPRPALPPSPRVPLVWAEGLEVGARVCVDDQDSPYNHQYGVVVEVPKRGATVKILCDDQFHKDRPRVVRMSSVVLAGHPGLPNPLTSPVQKAAGQRNGKPRRQHSAGRNGEVGARDGRRPRANGVENHFHRDEREEEAAPGREKTSGSGAGAGTGAARNGVASSGDSDAVEGSSEGSGGAPLPSPPPAAHSEAPSTAAALAARVRLAGSGVDALEQQLGELRTDVGVVGQRVAEIDDRSGARPTAAS